MDKNNYTSKIIELFGGIRPMASKLQIPVTTVQGWKKRGMIPANRNEEILKSAEKHGIKIEKWMLEASDSRIKDDKIEIEELKEHQIIAPVSGEIKPKLSPNEQSISTPNILNKPIIEKLAPLPQRAPAKRNSLPKSSNTNTMFMGIIIVLASLLGIGGYKLLMIQDNNLQHYQLLQSKLGELEAENNVLKNKIEKAVPEKLLTELSGQIAAIEQKVASVGDKSTPNSEDKATYEQKFAELKSEINLTKSSYDKFANDLASITKNTNEKTVAELLLSAVNQLKNTTKESYAYNDELSIVNNLSSSLLSNDAEFAKSMSILATHASAGVSSKEELKGKFTKLIPLAINENYLNNQNQKTGPFAVIFEKISQFVSIRRVPTDNNGTSLSSLLSRMEYKLGRGDIKGALKEYALITSPSALNVLNGWYIEAKNRIIVEDNLDLIYKKVMEVIALQAKQNEANKPQ